MKRMFRMVLLTLFLVFFLPVIVGIEAWQAIKGVGSATADLYRDAWNLDRP